MLAGEPKTMPQQKHEEFDENEEKKEELDKFDLSEPKDDIEEEEKVVLKKSEYEELMAAIRKQTRDNKCCQL